MTDQPETISKVTNNGTSYKVAAENQEITYQITSGNYAGKVDGENDYWNVYIPVSEIQEKAFPLNANPRQPNSVGSNESTDIVVKMRKTLKNNEHDFVLLNNGFTCVCSGLKPDDVNNPSELKIKWKTGEGILNGGHTYLAIHSTLPHVPDANVRVEFIVLSDTLQNDDEKRKEMIKNTAIARNSNRQLEAFTQAEFEGKHQILQNHLGELRSSIFFSEGYPDLNPELSKTTAMKTNVFVRYLSTLDRAWHWHPSINPSPKGKDIVADLIVKGNKAYDDWKIIALDDQNEKNLANVAPLGPLTLALADRMRESMRLELKPGGGAKNPIGCGSAFTTTRMFRQWAGKGQGSKSSVSHYDDSGKSRAMQLPASSPHYIAWQLNYIRPFIWFGDTEDDFQEMVGWYTNPVKLYNKLHKLIIKETSADFDNFEKMGSFATHKPTAKSIWDEVVEEQWNLHCSLDPGDKLFFPAQYFDPKLGKWFGQERTGIWSLIYNKDDEEWRTELVSTAGLASEDINLKFEEINPPY